MSSVDDGAGGRQANFLQKLFDFLALDPHPCPEVIYWAVDSKQLVIAQPDRLAREVLPRLYKHDKIASFGRQLNIYGFSRVFPGRQFKDASGMVLDASVWSHPTLHRLSTPAEVLSVKRRAAPKLFRNRRLANGQTVRTKAGPEVERKFRAIKEDMAMERRTKHFAGMGMGASVGAASQGAAGSGRGSGMGGGGAGESLSESVSGAAHDMEGGDEYERDGYFAGGASRVASLHPSQQQNSTRLSAGHEYYRRDNDNAADHSVDIGSYPYEYDEGDQPSWARQHPLSPTYTDIQGGPSMMLSGGGPFARASLEPIAEYGPPHAHQYQHPFADGISPLSTSLPLSPLSPTAPDMPTPASAFHSHSHCNTNPNSHRELASDQPPDPAFPASLWQTSQVGPIPSYFTETPYTRHPAQARQQQQQQQQQQPQQQPQPYQTHVYAADKPARVYRSCPASIHSSPTFKPMTVGLRPIIEHGADALHQNGHAGPHVHTHQAAQHAQNVQQYSPPQHTQGVNPRIAAPATGHPFASGMEPAWGNDASTSMALGGTASSTPSPVGLLPFGHDNHQQSSHQHQIMKQVENHPEFASPLSISPLSRMPSQLQPLQGTLSHSNTTSEQRQGIQGLTIEIPPLTGSTTFDASSQQGMRQYLSPLSGPPSAVSGLQMLSGHGPFNPGAVSQSDKEPAGSLGGSMGIGSGSGDRKAETEMREQQEQRPWQMTGSIDPKWVSPQGSTWNTPIQTPRGESPPGALPAFFPSL